MIIQSINHQNFKGDVFRIDDCWIRASGIYAPSEFIREYSSSDAQDYFIKAQHANTVEERQKFFDLMGEYRLILKENQKNSSNTLTKFANKLKNLVRK